MSTEAMPVVGGWSPLMPVDADMKEICMKAKPDIEKMAETKFEVYKPLLYVSRELMGGTTFVVKVRIDGGVCLNAKMFRGINDRDDDYQPTVKSVFYPAI